MKRTICIILTICMLAALAACTSPQSKNSKLSIVCSIFPQYDWVREILGTHTDSAELTLLLHSGVDLHNYSPTVDDILKISNADVFIYVGGESDKWVAEALDKAVNKNLIAINLMDVLGDNIKEEELKEGMQGEEEESEEEEKEYDEHIWLSLRNAQIFVEYIAGKIAQLDSANEEDYSKNSEAYLAKLKALDSRYSETVEKSSVKTLLFGDRFPFRYLTDDYSIDYYAAFIGCSAETEASIETVAFLTNKVDELSLKHVMILEGNSKDIAQTIIDNAKSKDIDILAINSIQSVTAKDISQGTTYLSLMEGNLSVLEKALS